VRQGGEDDVRGVDNLLGVGKDPVGLSPKLSPEVRVDVDDVLPLEADGAEGKGGDIGMGEEELDELDPDVSGRADNAYCDHIVLQVYTM